MVSILLVDDEQDWLQGVSRTLCGHKIAHKNSIHKARTGAEALNILQNHQIDLALLDLNLENESGEDILEQILRIHPQQNVVMMTGSNSIQDAVACIKKGAKDYFVKSIAVAELMANIKRIIKIRELELENAAIKKSSGHAEFHEYLTCSDKIHALFDYTRTIAKSSHNILISGESGVGKGVLARLIARMARPDQPFVSVNVAGYDELMFADALFGHAKGAYTGADSTREGMIKQAGNGVLFLDEIGDLSPQSQVKLLYLLQDGEYQPLGSDKTEKTNARFIFASNKDLALKVRDNTFRSDLFFRLNTHRIHIPPLRERKEDISLLVQSFAEQAAQEFSKTTPIFTGQFIEQISALSLPGNVRQIKSIIYDLVTRYTGIIDATQLSAMKDYTDFMEDTAAGTAVSLPVLLQGKLPTVEEMTNQLVRSAMDQADGNQVRAAQLLGISQPTLSRRLRKIKGLPE